MPETKQCPYCGETILAVAKKCKFCGSWIEPKHEFRCPVCCEVIPEDSIICPVCHERLRPDPEPDNPEKIESGIQEPIVEEQETDLHETKKPSPGSVSQKQIPFSKKKSWLSIIVGCLVVGLVCFFVFKPAGGGNNGTIEAMAVHEYLYGNLGRHIVSFSGSPLIEKRLTKLVGKKTFSQMEELFLNSTFKDSPNVVLSHEESGADVYTVFAVKQSSVDNDSFTIKYVDYGNSGFFDVVSFVGGKRKAKRELVKTPEMIEPIVRTYEYTGEVTKGRNWSNISMTLWVDSFHSNNPNIRGTYKKTGDEKSYYILGRIKGNAPVAIEMMNQEKTSIQFKLAAVDEKLSNLFGSYEEHTGNFGVETSSVSLSLFSTDPQVSASTGIGTAQAESTNDNEASVKNCIQSLFAEVCANTSTDLESKYCSKGLLKAIEAVYAYEKNRDDIEIGFLDEGVLYGYPQDAVKIVLSNVTVISADNKKASAKFDLRMGSGEYSSVSSYRYDLVKEHDEWKIDNVIHTGDYTFDLREGINEYLSN